ncbi:MAG: hypothetical protein R2932_46635 [Caldilineaceae bacterium]
MRVLNLNSIVTEFKQMVDPLIGETIVLQTHLACNLQQIKADQGQLEQVLMNLVVNARDAMPNGGLLTIQTENVIVDEAAIEKYTSTQAPGHYVMLAVSDTDTGWTTPHRNRSLTLSLQRKAKARGPD